MSEELNEARTKKIVDRKGRVRKTKTAGRKGKKYSGGKIKSISGREKRNKRLGAIKKRKTMRTKSSAQKKRSAMFSKLGRAKRKKLGVKDNRKG